MEIELRELDKGLDVGLRKKEMLMTPWTEELNAWRYCFFRWRGPEGRL